MTNEEYLKSLDIPGSKEVNTVTIPLAYYNDLLASHVKLCTVRDFAKAAPIYADFKGEVEVLLGLREEGANA